MYLKNYLIFIFSSSKILIYCNIFIVFISVWDETSCFFFRLWGIVFFYDFYISDRAQLCVSDIAVWSMIMIKPVRVHLNAYTIGQFINSHFGLINLNRFSLSFFLPSCFGFEFYFYWPIWGSVVWSLVNIICGAWYSFVHSLSRHFQSTMFDLLLLLLLMMLGSLLV